MRRKPFPVGCPSFGPTWQSPTLTAITTTIQWRSQTRDRAHSGHLRSPTVTEPRVIAVLDWELSTIGNPLADFSNLLMQWVNGVLQPYKDKPEYGIPTMDEYVAEYCRLTGRAGLPNPPDWDHIPGAHGSTPQALAYSEAYGHFRRLGVKLFGLSLLSTEWQRDFVARNGLSFRLLSDSHRLFSSAMGLPLFETGGQLYLQRMTFVAMDGIIQALRYPIPEPEQDPAEVLALLQPA